MSPRNTLTGESAVSPLCFAITLKDFHEYMEQLYPPPAEQENAGVGLTGDGIFATEPTNPRLERD